MPDTPTPYPWLASDTIVVNRYKTVKTIESITLSDQFTVEVISCIENDPDVCSAVYFIHFKQFAVDLKTVCYDQYIGPLHRYQYDCFIKGIQTMYEESVDTSTDEMLRNAEEFANKQIERINREAF